MSSAPARRSCTCRRATIPARCRSRPPITSATGPSSRMPRTARGSPHPTARGRLLERAVLVYRLGDEELPAKKGGPVRLLLTGEVQCQAEEIDACVMVKGLARIRLTSEREADVGHKHH